MFAFSADEIYTIVKVEDSVQHENMEESYGVPSVLNQSDQFKDVELHKKVHKMIATVL